ncbi:MAG: hypothetical protein N2Z22_04060 [Turneriella sp.]|nr:hypothetical protein [Turneriella sp.]
MRDFKILLQAAVFLAFGKMLYADSPCKGLDESACKANDKCTWVSGYTQKDGDKVKAYCRAKPGQGDSAASKDKKGKDKKAEPVAADEAPEKGKKQKKKGSSGAEGEQAKEQKPATAKDKKEKGKDKKGNKKKKQD